MINVIWSAGVIVVVGMTCYFVGKLNEQRKSLKRSLNLVERWTETWIKHMYSFEDLDSVMAFHDFITEMGVIIYAQIYEIE